MKKARCSSHVFRLWALLKLILETSNHTLLQFSAPLCCVSKERLLNLGRGCQAKLSRSASVNDQSQIRLSGPFRSVTTSLVFSLVCNTRPDFFRNPANLMCRFDWFMFLQGAPLETRPATEAAALPHVPEHPLRSDSDSCLV